MNTDDLPFPYRHHANAAVGWLMLRDWNSAELEMLKVPDLFAAARTVLKIQIRVYLKTGRSQQALALAETLVKRHPNDPEGWNHRSLALQNLGRIEVAYVTLLPALSRFPDHAAISYNLGCFLCQLGRTMEAVHLLACTFAVDDSSERRMRALADPDLKPLWRRLKIRAISEIPTLWFIKPCLRNQTEKDCASRLTRNNLN